MAKYLPHGTTFSIGGDLVGGLVAVTIPDRTKGEVESTDTNSAFDRTYIPGLREGGTVELTFRHMPGDVGQEALASNFAANGDSAIESCVITLPNVATATSTSRTYTFNGFVVAAPAGELGLIEDEVAEFTCTIKVAGVVTIAD